MSRTGLYLHASNQMEELAKAFSRIVQEGENALLPHTVVVQSKGMEKWLSQQVAFQNGICANIQFPFPDRFFREICNEILASEKVDERYSTEITALKLYSIFTDSTIDKKIPEISSYLKPSFLSEEEGIFRRFQFAETMAELYDQYTIFRPYEISEWSRGKLPNDKNFNWQGRLWQELGQSLGGSFHHRAWQQKCFLEKIQEIATSPFPFSRISVFGISYLPPFYLTFFAALSRLCEVHWFALNPSQEYWGELEELKNVRFPTATSEKENRLLQIFGKGGAYIWDFWLEMETEISVKNENHFTSLIPQTLLEHVQTDILHLEETTKKIEIDDSIIVRPAVTPVKELENLYDFLLDRFEKNSSLLPNDILVMMPSVETYAPYISSIFSPVNKELPSIPFSIADRSLRYQNPLAEAINALLQTLSSRLTVTDVFSLLDYPAIRMAFDIAEENIPTLHNWVEKARIRWGYDSRSKTMENLPPYAENTWQMGFYRLFLGYATGQAETDIQGVFPMNAVEGTKGILLGNFSEFVSQLSDWIQEAKEIRSIQNWVDLFEERLSKFLKPTTEAEKNFGDEFLLLLQEFRNRQKKADVNDLFDAQTFLHMLQKKMDKITPFGFLAGGVTFCSMLPMRSVPAKVICMIGMGEGKFPKTARRISLDMMKNSPRRGDRDRREDDKYLFLETILSARESLYISYTQAAEKKSAKNEYTGAASVVEDFLTVLRDYTEKDLRERLCLPSYLHSSIHANTEEILPKAIRNSLRCSPLKEDERNIPLQLLLSFFRKPQATFVKKRLGFYLEENQLQDVENFSVDGLDKYAVSSEIIKTAMDGKEVSADILYSKGLLPHGKMGEICFSEIRTSMQPVLDRIPANFKLDRKIIPIQVDISSFQISGNISLFNVQLIDISASSNTWGKGLTTWVKHLLLCVCGEIAGNTESILIGKDGQRRFIVPKEPVKILTQLMDVFDEGMQEPILIFHDKDGASSIFMESFAPKMQLDEAQLDAIEKKILAPWAAPQDGYGYVDPYVSFCYGEKNPITKDRFEEFVILTRSIFEEMARHQIWEKF